MQDQDEVTIDAVAARQTAAKAKQEERYRGAIAALLCDGEFCDEDRVVLDSFRAHLDLTDAEAEEVFRLEAGRYIRRRILEFLEDGQLSPHEDEILEDLVRSVGLGPQWAEETELALGKARRTWALASGPLPVIASDLGLLRGEVAYVREGAQAYEERQRTVGVSYAGMTLSIPIVKGVRFRAGQYGVNRQSIAYMHELGHGELTVTNRRLIFKTPKRAITARLTSIIDMTAYSDGFAIQKTTGKPVTYLLDYPGDDFALILWRAWQEARMVSAG